VTKAVSTVDVVKVTKFSISTPFCNVIPAVPLALADLVVFLLVAVAVTSRLKPTTRSPWPFSFSPSEFLSEVARPRKKVSRVKHGGCKNSLGLGVSLYPFAEEDVINEFIDILIHPYRNFTVRINVNGAPEKPATVALFVA
jgi:hypothetical protein